MSPLEPISPFCPAGPAGPGIPCSKRDRTLENIILQLIILDKWDSLLKDKLCYVGVHVKTVIAHSDYSNLVVYEEYTF